MLRFIWIWILIHCSLGAQSKTIHVNNHKGLAGVQDAINIAQLYDEILLEEGVYTGEGLYINKPIILRGNNNVILDGGEKVTILTIEGTAALVEGLTFRNTGYSSVEERCAIKLLSARGCIITNNKIEHCCFGIMLMKSGHSIITDNNINATNIHEQRSGNGIHGWQSDSLTIRNNNIQGHRDGIYFEFVTCTGVYNNKSINNLRYGIHFMFSNNDEYIGNTFSDNGSGVAVMFSHHVNIRNNAFDNCMGGASYGILLKEINDSQIINNKFRHNTNGIFMEGTNRITLQRNLFLSNGWACRVQASCSSIYLNENNFIGNSFDIATNGSLSINNFNGNYWDKYEGYDLDKNHIGDIPFSPVSMYGVIVERMPYTILLYRSLMVYLLDRSEKVLPGITSEQIKDKQPLMHAVTL